MKKILIAFLFLTATTIHAAEFDPHEVNQLKAVLDHNIEAMNNENIEEYMKDIHPKSIAYNNTKMILKKLFTLFDLKSTNLDITPLFVDGKYFIIKGRTQTLKIAGDTPFSDHIIDGIHIYKKHDGKWLLWNSIILEIVKLGNVKMENK
ncbi:MAG: hypothetical protein HN826_01230 [Methylococcales bacterium]|jgi:hypothetical protein|nr:hypothetical protein [Methylococcales bacterium]